MLKRIFNGTFCHLLRTLGDGKDIWANTTFLEAKSAVNSRYKNWIMKAKFLFTILLPALTIGCDEEDKLASIEGSWRGTKAEGEVVIYGVPSGFEEQDESFDPILEFETDGTVKITDDGTPAEGTWSQTGNILTTAVTFNTEFIDLSGDYTIESLTDTKLVLYYEKDGTYSDPDTGIEIEGTLKATLYFDKR